MYLCFSYCMDLLFGALNTFRMLVCFIKCSYTKIDLERVRVIGLLVFRYTFA